MNLYARFDEIPAMTLQNIEETKRYGNTHGHLALIFHGKPKKGRKCLNQVQTNQSQHTPNCI